MVGDAGELAELEAAVDDDGAIAGREARGIIPSSLLSVCASVDATATRWAGTGACRLS